MTVSANKENDEAGDGPNAQNEQEGENPLEDGAEESSDESFDPEAEYKKLQEAEQEKQYRLHQRFRSCRR